jgi:hypothetical protein
LKRISRIIITTNCIQLDDDYNQLVSQMQRDGEYISGQMIKTSCHACTESVLETVHEMYSS